MPARPEVRYCYACGHRVKQNAMSTCWYCGATTDRRLRPLRRCPFCEEEVGPTAVKCPHCREFLDGREAPSPSHVTYVIDKAVIQAPEPVALRGGQPVPAELRARLSPQTVHAIELDRPAEIDQQGVRALPAPESAGGDIVPAHNYEVAPTADMAPARVPDMPPAQIPQPAPKKPRVKSREVEEEVETEPEFRECSYCRTECLGADNFCYHCGGVLRQEAIDARNKLQKRGKSNLWLMLCTLVLLGTTLWIASQGGTVFGLTAAGGMLAATGCAAVAGILILTAFFRIRDSINQFLALVLAVLWLASAGYAGVLFVTHAPSAAQTTSNQPQPAAPENTPNAP